ncbi:class I SAM-dependent methyltransferase [Methylibium sp.]|uniref:class I SAM-dependent methyltransferase n=1 Tax=Methylibium sp. TaxID=2067992 RepID=UPI003D0EC45D
MGERGSASNTSAAPAPSLAPHYERIALDRHLKAGRALAASMGLRRGERVLELGCGTGLLAAQLADRVGAEGEVLGLDALPLRVQIAHQRSRHNLRFQVGDVYQLARFGAGSFEAIVANGVLHGWPDAARALAECARLLVPGGRLGLVTPAGTHPHPAQQVQAALLAEPPYAGHAPPEEGRRYAVGAVELDGLLRRAGFAPVCVDAQPEVILHASGDGAIEFMQASAWGHFLMHLPEALRVRARAEIVRRLEALRGPEGIRHDAMHLVAIACKPLPQPAQAPRSGPGP